MFLTRKSTIIKRSRWFLSWFFLNLYGNRLDSEFNLISGQIVELRQISKWRHLQGDAAVICRSAYKGKQSQPHAWWHAVAETTGAEESCAERQAEPAATVINCHQPPPCYVCGRPTTPCRPTAGADCTVRIMVEPVSSASKHAYRYILVIDP